MTTSYTMFSGAVIGTGSIAQKKPAVIQHMMKHT